MANRDWPRGMRALNVPNGDAPKVEAIASVSTVLYEGALLFLSSTTGLVGMASSSIVTSAMAKMIVGVCAAGKAAGASVQGSVNKVLAYTDPDQLFVIQSDDATVSTQATLRGKPFFGISTPAAGVAATLRSTAELNGDSASSVATSSIARCLEVQKLNPLPNSALGANAAVVVRILSKFHKAAQ